MRINGRRELIYLALAAAEVCWVSPIFLVLNQAISRHRPLLLWLGMLILLLGFFYFYRALVQANLSLRLQQTLLTVALLASIFLVIRGHLYAGLTMSGGEWIEFLGQRLATLTALVPDEVLAALALIYLWARGMHLARRSISTESAGYSFRSGIVIFIWFGLGIALLTGKDLTPYILPFFFFALVAIALARIEEISHLPGGSQAPFSGYWAGSSIVAVALLLLLGMAVALFFNGGSLRQILTWLSPVFYLLLMLLFALALLFFTGLDWLFSLLPVNWEPFRQFLDSIISQVRSAFPELTSPGDAVDPATVRAFTISSNVILLASLVAVVLLLTWYRLRRAQDREADETRESLLSAAALARSLRDLLQAGRQRLGDLADLAGRLGLERFLSAISIRRIYVNLVRLATEQGYPRAAAQTPYEYIDTLHQALPGSEAESALITQAYIDAHYGQLPDTPHELQLIRDAWERVRVRQADRQKEAHK
jgi:uncharacterized membrane protein YidH (DUF202 family)